MVFEKDPAGLAVELFCAIYEKGKDNNPADVLTLCADLVDLLKNAFK